MSRIGKKAIEIPAGVNVSIDGRKVTVSKGDKTLHFQHRPEVRVAWGEDEKSLVVEPAAREGTQGVKAYWGLTRAMIQNMVIGVTQGYEKKLEVVGVGYTAEVAGRELKLKVGFANTITMPIPTGLEVAADRQGNISIKGTDKQLVGNFAASVRAVRKPEPYNGKGIKYAGEVIQRKQGKAFGS